MPEPTGKSSWNVLAAGSSFEKLAYLLVPVTSSQNWRGTPSARKVSTPSWTSLRQPADNVKGDSEQAHLMKPPNSELYLQLIELLRGFTQRETVSDKSEYFFNVHRYHADSQLTTS